MSARHQPVSRLHLWLKLLAATQVLLFYEDTPAASLVLSFWFGEWQGAAGVQESCRLYCLDNTKIHPTGFPGSTNAHLPQLWAVTGWRSLKPGDYQTCTFGQEVVIFSLKLVASNFAARLSLSHVLSASHWQEELVIHCTQIAFHDCVGPDGCNGCLDINHQGNRGKIWCSQYEFMGPSKLTSFILLWLHFKAQFTTYSV